MSDVRICYAPLGDFAADARVMIVGITPGFTQAQIAFEAARRIFLSGGSAREALVAAEGECSFAGAMRSNLVRMLDDLGIVDHLGIASTDAFFTDTPAGSLCNSTSAIRYPTFVDGKNFTGHKPQMLEHEHLRTVIEVVLANELRSFDDVLVVPCGEAVSAALLHMKERGMLSRQHLLIGFPHASGANGHRARQFKERKEDLATVVESWARA